MLCNRSFVVVFEIMLKYVKFFILMCRQFWLSDEGEVEDYNDEVYNACICYTHPLNKHCVHGWIVRH